MSVEIIKYGDPFKGSQGGLNQGNIKMCTRVVALAKTLAPVAPQFGGTLRNSYMFKVGTNMGIIEGGFNDDGGEIAEKKLSGSPEKGIGYVGSNVDYSVYQEFGTRKMAPQPHLRPAISIVVKGESVKDALAKIQREEMNGALKKGQKREVF